jgi:Pyruvate/2-oxoacid:ferredoxin oxidoreductase gamma subunit
MLGALFGTGRLPIKVSTIKEAIEERFPAKLAPVNMKAFDLGYESCRRALK